LKSNKLCAVEETSTGECLLHTKAVTVNQRLLFKAKVELNFVRGQAAGKVSEVRWVATTGTYLVTTAKYMENIKASLLRLIDSGFS
jgi:hypothetical protein